MDGARWQRIQVTAAVSFSAFFALAAAAFIINPFGPCAQAMYPLILAVFFPLCRLRPCPHPQPGNRRMIVVMGILFLAALSDACVTYGLLPIPYTMNSVLRTVREALDG